MYYEQDDYDDEGDEYIDDDDNYEGNWQYGENEVGDEHIDNDDEGNEQEYDVEGDESNGDTQVQLQPVVKRTPKPCPHTGQPCSSHKMPSNTHNSLA